MRPCGVTTGKRNRTRYKKSGSSGLYSIRYLGNTEIPGMEPLEPIIFGSIELYLRVWFDDGVNGFVTLPLINESLASRALVAHIPNSKSAEMGIGQHRQSGSHYHRPVERANPQVFEARNYPRPAGPRIDLRRADRHPAIPSGRKVSILSMAKKWSAHRGSNG